MYKSLAVEGHFNPGLFNPRLFHQELFNHEFLNHGVEKFMVGKSGVEKSRVEMTVSLYKNVKGPNTRSPLDLTPPASSCS